MFLVVFWCLFDTKKHRFGVFLVQLFGELFLVYSLANTLVFWLLTPVSVGVGSEIGQICGVFSSKDSKNAHFFDLFERLHPP